MTDFINHYETLEVSASASFETVERVFRYLAQRYHPDSTEHGDIQKFAQIAEAYEVLGCLLYTSPSPRDATLSRMPSSA